MIYKNIHMVRGGKLSMVNLQKGSKVSLKKEDSTLKKLEVGLGWDTRTDLDSIAYLFDSDNKARETVCFFSKDHEGIFLNGDNLTGEGEGDDEVITVTLDKLPEWVTKISFCANIYAARIKLWGVKDFSKVNGAYIRIVNAVSQNEICRYDLQENGKGFNAFYFADLIKNGNEWEFIAVGRGMNGSVEKIQKQLENR